MVEVRRRKGESGGALMFRFTRRIQQSGVLKEAKKRRFYDRTPNRAARRRSAIYRGRAAAERRKEQ